MKYILQFVFSILIAIQIQAQDIPRVTLQDSSQLKLSVLNIDVKVVGNISTTTYDMKFYNSSNRILEGELAFPLGQGQTVSHFAMDVNGRLRDAVIVEKEVARVAYESTVRQTIDPGLLEMTQGNNYKARVYPIPANGYKRIVITYEQIMFAKNKTHNFELPLQFKDQLEEFSLRIEVLGVNNLPKINKGESYGLDFTIKENNYKAEIRKTKFIPKETISIELPLTNDEKVSTYNDYFNIYKVLNPKQRLKKNPKSITVFWDASYSMQYRDLESELELLESYIKYLDNVKVEFVSFNNKVKPSKIFNIKSGNCDELKNHIHSIIYDGGTSYLDLKNHKSDEYLFFTDGMDNLGDFSKDKNPPIYTINSVTSANHQSLERLSTKSGGNYINLNRKSIESALKVLKNETYQFLGISDNANIFEVYPTSNTNVTEDFSISGRFNNATKIELLFGYTNEVTDRFIVELNRESSNAITKRIWAKEKLKYLNHNKEENKDKIIALAIRYKLISSFTSMIVLDRIEDYVRYKIEPPKELKEEYKRRIALQSDNNVDRLEEINDRKEELFDDYKDLLEWYKTDFLKKKKKTKKDIKVANTNPNRINENVVVPNTNNTDQLPSTNTVRQNDVVRNSQITIDTTKRVVFGAIFDQNNLPLSGVNVLIKDTTRRAQTDFDGNYSINAEIGDILVFSYIGFKDSEKIIGNSTNINMSLEEDSSNLDEVVIVGYATVKRSSVSYSLTTVTSESIEQVPIASLDQLLQGNAAGVSVNTGGQLGSSGTIIIRGRSSLLGDVEPLFIIDGIPVDQDNFRNLNQNNIASLSVLKDAEAAAIYGNRGVNGVVIVTTKEGQKSNSEKIEALNKKIDERIELKPWTPNASYLQELSKCISIDEAYLKYLELRTHYSNTPTFFIDVADFFESKNRNDLAIQIITNLIEIDLDNHELMKALAYKLEYFKEDVLAVFVYKKVLELRPEEPQSYRDLALAYENVGEYQKAFNLLYRIVNGELLEKDTEERYYGIEHLAYVEACHLITLHKKKLKLNKEQKKLFKEFKVDLRVVVDWNHNDTDLDLWVENPNNEKVSYKNSNTEIGDRLSEDLMDGYGPEEYLLKKAIKGNYEILVDYYSDNVQKISGPTSLKITIYTNYGKSNEKKEIKILRLDKEEDEIEIGKVKF